MAVPTSSYSSNVTLATESGVVRKVQYYPKALSAYGSDAVFKTKFFVDGVLDFRDASGTPCVLGYVSASSANVNMRDPSRIGKLRANVSGSNYIILNDGGLNTKPKAEFGSGGVAEHYTNLIRVACNVISAYYLATTKFTVHVFKNNVEVDSFDFQGVAANDTLTGYVAELRNIASVSNNDTVVLKISAVNAEGTYTNPNTISVVLRGAGSGTIVYRHTTAPTSQTNPTSGTPYLMLIDEAMYSSTTFGNNGGTLYRLFQITTGDELRLGASTGGEWLQGSADTTSLSNMGYLPDGWYYGVPNTWQGDDLKYVRISGSGANNEWLWWQDNTYVVSNFSVSMSASGYTDRSTGEKVVTFWAKLTGTHGSVTVTSPIYIAGRPGRPGTYVTTLIGSGSNNTINLGTVTRPSGTEETLTTGDMNYGSPLTTTDPAANSITEHMISTRDLPTN